MAGFPTQDPRGQLLPYLRPGETLLWAGRPDPAVVFVPSDAFLVPVTVLWAGFSVFWFVGATAAGGAFGLFGVPFMVMGAYMTVGRFIVKRRRKEKTAYGVTKDRALVAVGETSLSESPVAHMPLHIRRGRDGRHVSVTFGNGATGIGWMRSMYANTGIEFFGGVGDSVGFYDVADGEDMLAAINRARGN